VRSIIDEMRKANPNLRVMGLTATPYRLGTGYIFAMWPDQSPTIEAHDPYFTACVDRIGAHELIELGYLTRPSIGSINAGAYDTATLSPNARGKFDAAAVDQAYHGHGRLTASIVADVVEQARDRKGVMFFAATVRHAQEIMASLPPAMSEIVTGETKAKDRQNILRRFKAQDIKYLVNVSVLTTGFDAPHVDCIAILRKTESVGLLQQIIGRGLRLDAGKSDCLVLDYTTNIADHCPDGDLFSPKIKSGYASGGDGMPFQCPTCEGVNHFTPRGDYLDADSNFTVPVDPAGYVLDIDGHQVKVDGQPMPAHFGRRCMCLVQIGPRGEWDRCAYRWTYKPCPECDAENDIAARYCSKCRAEIVDPNERLVSDFIAKKKDPHNLQTDLVMSIAQRAGVSRSGNRTERLDIVTPHRSFSVWLMPDSLFAKGQQQWREYQSARSGETLPRTVTYRKNVSTGFYEVLGWNRPEDKMPDVDGEKYAAQ
jgi:DNA repair protein RadD